MLGMITLATLASLTGQSLILFSKHVAYDLSFEFRGIRFDHDLVQAEFDQLYSRKSLGFRLHLAEENYPSNFIDEYCSFLVNRLENAPKLEKLRLVRKFGY